MFYPTWQNIYDNIFGGPPWGDTLKNYTDFSPYFNLEKVKTPLLLEFASYGSPLGLEMYNSLKYLKVTTELVIYEGEEHNFVNPKARVASMARKADWFNYWLLGKVDPNPAKKEQYKRWDAMKEEAPR